jgi:hypothetical protein
MYLRARVPLDKVILMTLMYLDLAIGIEILLAKKKIDQKD